MFLLGASLFFLPHFYTTLNQRPSSVVADAIGNAYVASADSNDINTGWLTKVGPDGRVLYRITLSHGFLGGLIYATPDSQGNVYAAVGGLDHGYNPAAPNYFAVKIDPNGNIVYSLPIASAGGNFMSAPAIGPDGSAYFTGGVYPITWAPTTPGVWVSSAATVANQMNAFVIKVSPAGDHIVYSTFLDSAPPAPGAVTGFPQAIGISIAVDPSGAAYVSGVTNDPGYPATPCSTCGSVHGLFVSKLSPDGSHLVYSTYLAPWEINSYSNLQTHVDPSGNLQVVTVPLNGSTVRARILTADGRSLMVDNSFTPAPQPTAPAAVSAIPDGQGNVIVTGLTSQMNLTPTDGALQNGPGTLAIIRMSDGEIQYCSRLAVAPEVPIYGDRSQVSPDGTGGFLVLGSAGAANEAWSMTRFTPATLPAASIFGVSNLAESNTSAAIAPGELLSIIGVGIGPAGTALGTYDSGGRLPTLLGGTQVLINGTPAPIISASSQEAIVEVPFELTPSGLVSIELVQGGATSTALIPASSVEPAILVSAPPSPNSLPFALAVNADGTINSANNPALGGSVVAFYINGAGALSGNPSDGTAGKAGQNILASVTAVVNLEQAGGNDGLVVYAGAAPALTGLTQVNVELPAPPYARPIPADPDVVLTIGGTTLLASIWVKPQ